MNKDKPGEGSVVLLIWCGIMMLMALGAGVVGAIEGDPKWYGIAVAIGGWGFIYGCVGAAIRD